MTKEIYEALRAIVDGYPGSIKDGYLMVENPKYQPDDGSNPNLVIECSWLLALLDPR